MNLNGFAADFLSASDQGVVGGLAQESGERLALPIVLEEAQ
jgi:hypothetical protein